MMTRDELEQFLVYDPEENERLYMPNEIFYDLSLDAFPEGSSHVAFAYSFYYLISYLYRFCKYGTTIGRVYTVPTLKKVLGYAENNKRIDYVIKKNGILDRMGYTETSTNYPISWDFDDYDGLIFHMYRDLDVGMQVFFHEQYGNPPRIKVPLKGYDRDCHEYEGVGTFFRFKHTTRISVEVFLKCMTDESLGTIGFYLYSWLKYKSEYYGGNFSAPLWYVTDFSGIKETTLKKYLKTLESNNMISVERPKYDPTISEEQRKSNIYKVRDWREFADVTAIV